MHFEGKDGDGGGGVKWKSHDFFLSVRLSRFSLLIRRLSAPVIPDDDDDSPVKLMERRPLLSKSPTGQKE